jgi:hypothetical protein
VWSRRLAPARRHERRGLRLDRPWLILVSALLLALQDRMRAWLARRGATGHSRLLELAGIGAAAV